MTAGRGDAAMRVNVSSRLALRGGGAIADGEHIRSDPVASEFGVSAQRSEERVRVGARGSSTP
jgi:hypothetical protein